MLFNKNGIQWKRKWHIKKFIDLDSARKRFDKNRNKRDKNSKITKFINSAVHQPNSPWIWPIQSVDTNW